MYGSGLRKISKKFRGPSNTICIEIGENESHAQSHANFIGMYMGSDSWPLNGSRIRDLPAGESKTKDARLDHTRRV
jgi:hypothetical protein